MMRNTRYKIQDTRYKRGFTLVEVLVSVGIFLLTIMAISQIFITVIRSERVAYALLNSENNIRNNLELMARTIRMGKNFNPSPDDKELCFDYYLENQWQNLCYKFNPGSEDLEKSLNNGDYYSLLDPQIQVVSGNFYKIGGTPTSQWLFIIQLEVQVKVRGIEYPFHVETAVASRYIGQ